MIRLENVSKSYVKGIPALDDVNIHITPGEFVFIVGESGSGKSTFIKLLLKEIEPTKGKVYINGQDLAKVKGRRIPRFRRNVGIVFQNFRLLQDRTIYENVAFALKVVETPPREVKPRVIAALKNVGLPAKYKAYPKQLSGGEQQRVAIARALVNNPKIILADEPTGNLDNTNAWAIMELLDEINKKGTTVIVVTHNTDIVNAMKKRVITIKQGRVVSDDGGAEDDD